MSRNSLAICPATEAMPIHTLPATLAGVPSAPVTSINSIGRNCPSSNSLAASSRAERNAVGAGQVITPAGRDDGEQAVTAWLRPGHRTGDRARHPVAADRDHVIASQRRLGCQPAGIY